MNFPNIPMRVSRGGARAARGTASTGTGTLPGGLLRPVALLLLLLWTLALAAPAYSAPPTTCTDSVPTTPAAPIDQRSCACSWVDPAGSGAMPKLLNFAQSYTDPVTAEAVKSGLIFQVGSAFVYNRTLAIRLGTQITPNAPESTTKCTARLRAINTTACSSTPLGYPVVETLYGAWREIAGCGWTLSNTTTPGYDTYVNTVYMRWTDYFADGNGRTSSLPYQVTFRLPKEVNVSTNASLASVSGIRNLIATGFSVAFVTPGSRQMTVSLDYQVYSNWPHSLTFNAVIPPADSSIASVGNVTILDPSSKAPQCFTASPSTNTSATPVNSTATQCWQSGRATFLLPADACSGPNATYDVGGLYTWQFIAGCYPPTFGNVDQGFAVSDCRSAVVQATSSIVTGSTSSTPILDVCAFAILYTAQDSLTIDLKYAGNSTSLPGEDNTAGFKFGDAIVFFANVSSNIVQVTSVDLIGLSVAKWGSDSKPNDKSMPGFNESMAVGLQGPTTPGYLAKLGQATGLGVADVDNTTLRVSCVPNMGPNLEGYFLTPADDGQILRFTFYARFAVTYEAGKGGARRRVIRDVSIDHSTLGKRADVDLKLPPAVASARSNAEYEVRFSVGNVGGNNGGDGGTNNNGTTTNPGTSSTTSTGGLSIGAIVGIAVGGAAGAALVVGGIIALTRKSKKPAKKEDEDGFLWQGESDLERLSPAQGDEKPHEGQPPANQFTGLGEMTLANLVLPTDGVAGPQVSGQLPDGALEGLGAATLANLVPAHAAAGAQQGHGVFEGLGQATLANLVPAHAAAGAQGQGHGVFEGLGQATLENLVPAHATSASHQAPNPALPHGLLDGLGAATLANLIPAHATSGQDAGQTPNSALPQGTFNGLGEATLANLVPAHATTSAASAAAPETGAPTSALPTGVLDGLGAATLNNLVTPSGEHASAPAPALASTTAATALGLPEGALAGLGAATLAGLIRPDEGFDDSLADLGEAEEFIFDPRSPAEGAAPTTVTTTTTTVTQAMPTMVQGADGTQQEVASDLPLGLLAGLGAATLANLVTPTSGPVAATPTTPTSPVEGSTTLAALPKKVVRRMETSPVTSSPMLTPALLSPPMDTRGAPSPRPPVVPSPRPPVTSSPYLAPSQLPLSPALAPAAGLTPSGAYPSSPYLSPSQGLLPSPGLPSPGLAPSQPYPSPSLGPQAYSRSPALTPSQPYPTSPNIRPSPLSAPPIQAQSQTTTSPELNPSALLQPLPNANSYRDQPPSQEIPLELLGLGDKTLAGLVGPNGSPALTAMPRATASPIASNAQLSPAERLEASIAELQAALRQPGLPSPK